MQRKSFSLISSIVLFLSALVIAETHSAIQPKAQESRPEAESYQETQMDLFDSTPGDLEEAEKEETEAISKEVRKALAEEHKAHGNLGKMIDWDKRQDKIQKLIKKLQNKLDRLDAKPDAIIAKKELESLLEISLQKKKRAWKKWINPFAN